VLTIGTFKLAVLRLGLFRTGSAKLTAGKPDGGLDDVVVKTQDEGEGSVGLELNRVLLQHRLEQVHVAGANG